MIVYDPLRPPHVITLLHLGDGCRVSCRRCGLLGEVSERIAGQLIAQHRRERVSGFRE